MLSRFKDEKKMTSVVNLMKGMIQEDGAFENRPNTIHLANCMLVLNEDALKFEERPFSPEVQEPECLAMEIRQLPGLLI
jgi:hypothetical protein